MYVIGAISGFIVGLAIGIFVTAALLAAARKVRG